MHPRLRRFQRTGNRRARRLLMPAAAEAEARPSLRRSPVCSESRLRSRPSASSLNTTEIIASFAVTRYSTSPPSVTSPKMRLPHVLLRHHRRDHAVVQFDARQDVFPQLDVLVGRAAQRPLRDFGQRRACLHQLLRVAERFRADVAGAEALRIRDQPGQQRHGAVAA